MKSGIDDVLTDVSDHGLEAVRDVAGSVSEALEETLQRRPLTTLGLALGVGFIAGAAWRR